jgi:hypothetical protein
MSNPNDTTKTRELTEAELAAVSGGLRRHCRSDSRSREWSWSHGWVREWLPEFSALCSCAGMTEKIMSKTNDDHRPLADSELDAVTGGLIPGGSTDMGTDWVDTSSRKTSTMSRLMAIGL